MDKKIFINDNWLYSENFSGEMIKKNYAGKMEKIRLPHTTCVTPYNNFSVELYQKNCIYKKYFITEAEWAGKKVFLTIEGAAHYSQVYLNEKLLAEHRCGYTAYTVDLTPALNASGEENILAIRVDSHENLNQPPFGYVIDYMTYGGIYRDVFIEIKNPVYIEDVFVHTDKNNFYSEITLSEDLAEKKYTLQQKILPGTNAPVTDTKNSCAEIFTGISGNTVHTSAKAAGIVQWNLENPALYNVETTLLDENDNPVDTKVIRFGFRDIRYDETGFYLNNKRIKIRGLNRHQSFPYVGYAMPKSMQIEDADILKFDLGLNEVRTSHYPQSQYFVNRCDEIGLLVFTEIPGWQHIGKEEWKNIAVDNVRDMVRQYRNHPSVFLWGVRINESLDDDEFYARTNAVCRELDPTRPTAGVRFLKNSNLLEDVYTFNDFSFYGENKGCLKKKNVTKTGKGYMISEYNGHMFPTKTFDSEAHRTEHAMRHAKVLDDVASRDEISGASGWCAFDYNTHKDFGSGDYICYHGVMDMFRNPKTAAYVYQSQGENNVSGDVLNLTSSMNIGEYPGGALGEVYAITNADSIKLYVNDIFIKEYSAKDSPYRNLKHGPILIDDYIGNRLVDEDGIKPKYLQPMKDMLYALQKYGVDKLPFRYIMKGAGLYLKRVTDVMKLRNLYAKYIGNWGGQSVCYRFESYRDGKLVKTVTRTAAKKATVLCTTSRTTLVEEGSYDVTAVHFTAVDENSNLLPYCQEAVKLSAEGAIEIIGPEVVSLKGGQWGTYIKSTGTAGKGKLTVTDWKGESSVIEFNVEVA